MNLNKFTFIIYLKGERGRACLEALLEKNIVPVLCVLENEDKSISDICIENNIHFIIEAKPRSQEHIHYIQTITFDLLVCAGYSKILPQILFQNLKYGGINCHGGKLPEYRGASPIPWQIIHGETMGAAYVLQLTAGVDDGPILAYEIYSITPEDTARSVTNKVLAIFVKIIPEVVEKFALGIKPNFEYQDEALSCHWTRRYHADGLIDWRNLTAIQVINLVRALDDPYPGAFFMHNNRQITIKKARIYPKKMAGISGRVVGKTQAGCLVLTKEGAVELLTLQAEQKMIDGASYPVKYGDMLC